MPSWKKIIVSGSDLSQLNNDSGYVKAGSANTFYADQTINGNLVVTGSITAQQYIISSSVIYITSSNFSGSNVFGNTMDDTHQFTGSVYITGSYSLIGNSTHTGSVYHSGSQFQIGTFNQTGSLNISGSTTQIGNNNLLGNTLLSGSITISGSTATPATPTIKVYGDMETNGVIKFLPVVKNIDTTISASYVYVSGSTNDIYFSQNGSGYSNATRLRWLESILYTGLLKGGNMTSTPGTTTFRVASGSGLIINQNASLSADPFPTVTEVSWPQQDLPITYSGSAKITYVGIDNTGTVIQQPYAWGSLDVTQWDTAIHLGVVLHLSGSVSTGVYNSPQISYGPAQRQDDFFRAFGPLKISGHTLLASGSTLGIRKAAGTSYKEGANYVNNPNHPSTVTENAITTSKIYRYHLSGSTPVIDTGVANAGYSEIDPTRYVNTTTGLLTTVTGNNSNQWYWTIQRVFWVPNSPTNAFIVYYGNAEYSTLLDAKNGIDTEAFTEAPNTALNAILIGYILVRKGCTDLSDTTSTNAVLIQGGLFRTVGGIGGSGASTITSLATLSDVTLTSPTNGDLLQYSSSAAKWINTKTLSGSYILTGSLNVSGSLTGSLFGSSSYALTASYALNGGSGTTFPFTGSAIITGSLIVTGSTTSTLGFTGSLFGTASRASTASYALTASFISPAGSNYEIQYNNGTALAASSNFQWIYPNQYLSITSNGSAGVLGNRSIYNTLEWGLYDGGDFAIAIKLEDDNAYSYSANTYTYYHNSQTHQITGSVTINGSLSQGTNAQAIGTFSHAQGSGSQAIGNFSHAEGNQTIASGSYSHAEGTNTIVYPEPVIDITTLTSINIDGGGAFTVLSSDVNTVVVPNDRTTSVPFPNYTPTSLAIGDGVNTISINYLYYTAPTITSATYDGGSNTTTFDFGGTLSATYQNVDVATTIASASYSHTEGYGTTTYGLASHAEGYATTAYGVASHAGGQYTIASGSYQTVVGAYNTHNNTTDLFVVGGGTSEGNRNDVLKVSDTAITMSGSININNFYGSPGLITTTAGQSQYMARSSTHSDRELRFQVYSDGNAYFQQAVTSGTATSDLILRTIGDGGTNNGSIRFIVSGNERLALTPSNITMSGSVNISGSLLVNGTAPGGSSVKAGQVTAGTFAGSPRTAAVSFNTNMTGDYSISIVGVDARSWTVQSIGSSGFTINSNSSVALTGNVYWTATPHSNP
jgi:hypothetical protein